MLASRHVQGSVSSILESLRNSQMDEAKRKLQTLASEVKTEREKGSLQAAYGIYWSVTKAKEGTMQTWDAARLERAVSSVRGSQFSDEFDQAYGETLLAYSKLIQKQQ